jgi:hypothetical protein
MQNAQTVLNSVRSKQISINKAMMVVVRLGDSHYHHCSEIHVLLLWIVCLSWMCKPNQSPFHSSHNYTPLSAKWTNTSSIYSRQIPINILSQKLPRYHHSNDWMVKSILSKFNLIRQFIQFRFDRENWFSRLKRGTWQTSLFHFLSQHRKLIGIMSYHFFIYCW